MREIIFTRRETSRLILFPNAETANRIYKITGSRLSVFTAPLKAGTRQSQRADFYRRRNLITSAVFIPVRAILIIITSVYPYLCTQLGSSADQLIRIFQRGLIFCQPGKL